MNDAQKALRDQYREQKKKDPHQQTCQCCNQRGFKKEMEPHHPKGRHGVNILIYIWVHPQCHRWIHNNPKEAQEKGLLISGRNT